MRSDNCLDCICALCYPVGWFGNMDRKFTCRTKCHWNFNHSSFGVNDNIVSIETRVAKATKKATGRRVIQQLNLKHLLKVVGFVLVLIVLLFGSIFFACREKPVPKEDNSTLSNSTKDESDLELKKELEKYYTAVLSFNITNVEEINEHISNGDCFYLYVGRSTCEWCRKLAPTLQSVAQNLGIDVYYLDSENSDANPPVKEFREQYSIQEVPAILYFENGNSYLIGIDITNKNFGVESLSEALQEYPE